jgi:hypothetical protein
LGRKSVSGLRRVPSPAAITIAFTPLALLDPILAAED